MTRTLAQPAPYSGAPALRIDRPLLAVCRQTLGRGFVIRDLQAGRDLTAAAFNDAAIGEALEVFAIFEDAIDAARDTGALLWHDYPTFEAAIAAAREV